MGLSFSYELHHGETDAADHRFGEVSLGSGIVVGKTNDGKLMVRVDGKTFVGYPVTATK
ncbi:hypothetical protein ACFSHQ_07525 [Gemmobacter lanyuensis]